MNIQTYTHSRWSRVRPGVGAGGGRPPNTEFVLSVAANNAQLRIPKHVCKEPGKADWLIDFDAEELALDLNGSSCSIYKSSGAMAVSFLKAFTTSLPKGSHQVPHRKEGGLYVFNFSDLGMKAKAGDAQ